MLTLTHQHLNCMYANSYSSIPIAYMPTVTRQHLLYVLIFIILCRFTVLVFFFPLPISPVRYCNHHHLSICPSTFSINTISHKCIYVGNGVVSHNNAIWCGLEAYQKGEMVKMEITLTFSGVASMQYLIKAKLKNNNIHSSYEYKAMIIGSLTSREFKTALLK